MAVALVVRLTAASGRREALIEAVGGHAQRTKTNEQGCLQFDVLRPAEGDDLVMLYEVYRDAAALDVHANSAHLKRFRDESKDLVVGREIIRCDRVE